MLNWFDTISLENLSSYAPILVFLLLSSVLGIVLIVVSLLLGKSRPNPEKLSPYECGFAPFNTARIKFDVRFYLVAILFIIFDLEIAFLFPWAVSFSRLSSLGFFSMAFFLIILTIGFAYEWSKGALEWE